MIDCVVLTETHLTNNNAVKFHNHFPDILIITNSPFHNSVGVTVISRNPERVRRDESTDIFYKDKYGRGLEISITINQNHGKTARKTRCLNV